MTRSTPTELTPFKTAAEVPPYNRTDIRFKQGLKRTSFYPTVGAVATTFKLHNTYLKPWFFTDVMEEYWAIRRTAGLLDVTGEEVVELTGPDALAVLDSVTPRDLRKLGDGRCRYAVLTYAYGGIVEDGIIVRFSAEKLWWIGGPAFAEQAIHGAAIGRNVVVRSLLDEWHTASLQGPQSRAMLQRVCEADLSRVGYYGMAETKVCGVPVVLLRAGFTAELGYDIFVRSRDGGQFFADLWDAVRPLGAKLCGSGSLGLRRTEASILNFGQDFDWTHTPYEIGLGWMVEKQGGFQGAEALRARAAAGTGSRLVGLHLDSPDAALMGDAVLAGDVRLGCVTSAAVSPALERSIAIAMLDAPVPEGTVLQVATGEETGSAKVVPMPFFDPKRELARA